MKINSLRVGDISANIQPYPNPKNQIYKLHWTENGKQKKQSLRTRDFGVAKSNAEKILLEVNAKYDNTKSLLGLYDFWYKHNKNKSDQYTQKVRRCFNPLVSFFGDIPADHLTDSDILNFRAHLDTIVSEKTKKKLSTSHKNNLLRHIKVVWTFCHDYDIVKRNLFGKMKGLQTEQRKDFLTVSQLKKIIENEKETEDEVKLAMTEFLIRTGWRLGELHKLKWEHIDTENQIITLPDTKTGFFRIKLRPGYIVALQKIQKFQPECEYVASDKDGKHLSYYTLGGFVKTCLVNAGFPNATAHTLRHSFITNLLLAGKSVTDVSTIVRHTTIQQTMKYAHIVDQNIKDEAADLFNELYGSYEIRETPMTFYDTDGKSYQVILRQ